MLLFLGTLLWSVCLCSQSSISRANGDRRSQIEKHAVVSVRSNLPQKSLVNSPFWTKVWTPPISISWFRLCFLKAVWLENIDEQNLQPDTLTDKGHPQATSCKPIYHDKNKQNSRYGKLWRSVVRGADDQNGIFFCEFRIFNSFRTVREHEYGSFD